jgi:Leucine-rich repeat (LRR) protein
VKPGTSRGDPNGPRRGASAVAVGVAILALSGAGVLAGRQMRAERLLGSWGLPVDLLSRQAQLETLALPPQVDRIGWVSGPRRLLASYTHIDRLDEIPPHVEELDVSHTYVHALPALPAVLKALDVRWSNVGEFGNRLAESHLESLKLAGRLIGRLPSLPASLRHLELADTQLRDVRGLPSGLRLLRLAGTTFRDLSGLPADLRELSLTGTVVRSVDPWPRALQTLEVDSNARFKLDRLPPFLSRLSIRNQSITDLSDLHFLVFVAIQGEEVARFPTWPASLRDLTLESRRPAPIPELPADLKSLDLSRYRGKAEGRLPTRLERLVRKVPGAPAVEESRLRYTGKQSFYRTPTALSVCEPTLATMGPLPATLKRLEIVCPSPRLTGLSGLPAGLEHLSVAGSGLEALPDLPPSLRSLDISNTKISTLAVLGLKKLHRLRALTLSAGQVRTLEGLPMTVTTLRFVESTGGAAARARSAP